MARPTVKDADFVGKAAYLRQRDEAPVATLCTLTVDDPTSRRRKRYMLGREPILDARRRADRRRERPRLVRHHRRLRPVGRQALLMAYLPPEHAVEGDEAAGAVHGRALSGDRRGRRLAPLFDPDNARIRC